MSKVVPIVSISPDGTVTHYPSIHEAARQTGINVGIISRVSNFGKMFRGLQWMREDEYECKGR